MKLRNKKTGFVTNWCIDKDIFRTCDGSIEYNSLVELNKDWEDYEEPKEYWYIDIDGEINSGDMEDDTVKDMRKIGNYFETEEEAEQAVEKLKAWKRLKDKGFRFIGWTEQSHDEITSQIVRCDFGNAGYDDLDLLFGGGE